MNDSLTFTVPGMTCGHCEAAVTAEVTRLDNVTGISVDLDSKDVVVTGSELDAAAIVAAIDEAGFDATLVS